MDLKNINFVKMAGAGLIIISVLFLPWIKIPFLGSGTILEMHKLINEGNQLERSFGLAPEGPPSSIFIILFVLVLLGGLIALFKAKVGAIIGIVGLVWGTLVGIAIASDFSSSFAIGYYLAWIGAGACLFSKRIYKAIKKV